MFGFFGKNWITCSWHQKTKPPIHEFKVLHKSQRAFQTPFLVVYYFLFITLKNILSFAFPI